jgi:hypothetical protein
VKQSRIKRLVPKKMARQLAQASGAARREIEAAFDAEAADAIKKMRAKGYRLVTRLETGEGIFVRDTDVVALHVQIPTALYKKLDSECRRREISKKRLVVEALEKAL